MTAHGLPFRFIERSRFLKDLIRDCDLAHIVQERASPEVGEFLLAESKLARDLECDLCHPLGMSLGFPIAQVERADPAFDGPLVGFAQLIVGGLQRLLSVFPFRDVAGGGLNLDCPFCDWVENRPG